MDFLVIKPMKVSLSSTTGTKFCSVARSTLLHYGYPGRIATAGNLAFPFSPSDIKVGETYVFSVYALLRTEDPLTLFQPVYEEVKP